MTTINHINPNMVGEMYGSNAPLVKEVVNAGRATELDNVCMVAARRY